MARPKTALVQVRLSTRDKQHVEALASSAGLTVSMWVRRLTRRALVASERHERTRLMQTR